MSKKQYWINIRFDNEMGRVFSHALKHVKHIGVRHGDYIVQFRSASAAINAIEKYKHALRDSEIAMDSNYADAKYYAELGNYEMPASVHPVVQKACFYWVK